jgi:hypothetical protein
MTIEELQEKYGWKESLEELTKRLSGEAKLHPIYHKHLPASWIIEDIWGHVANENMSLGKARELTTAVIEEHFNELNQKQKI